MWQVSSDRKTGEYHAGRRMECQDQVYYKKEDYRQAIVLADGTGASDINAACVSEVVKYTAEKLLDMARERDLQKMPKQELIRELMGKIIDIISGYMEKTHLTADHFGSTLLAFMVDARTGDYLLIHLGDGIIIGKDKQRARVLSWPVGCGGDRTFLTISENLLERIRIRYGNIGGLDQIALCSDGMYDHPLTRSFAENKIWEVLDGGKICLPGEDDQSFIQLRRVNAANECFDGNPRRKDEGIKSDPGKC